MDEIKLVAKNDKIAIELNKKVMQLQSELQRLTDVFMVDDSLVSDKAIRDAVKGFLEHFIRKTNEVNLTKTRVHNSNVNGFFFAYWDDNIGDSVILHCDPLSPVVGLTAADFYGDICGVARRLHRLSANNMVLSGVNNTPE